MFGEQKEEYKGWNEHSPHGIVVALGKCHEISGKKEDKCCDKVHLFLGFKVGIEKDQKKME